MRLLKSKTSSVKGQKSASDKSSDEDGSWVRRNRKKLLLLLLFVALVAALFPRLEFNQYQNLKVGAIADRDVVAPFTFYVYKSPSELEADREEAARRVLPIFRAAPEVPAQQLARLDSFFTEIHILQKSGVSDTIRKIEILGYCHRGHITLTDEEADFFVKMDTLSAKEAQDFEGEIKQILRDLYAIGIIDQPKEKIRKINPRIQILEMDQRVEKNLNFIYDLAGARQRILDRLRARFPNSKAKVHAGYALAVSFLKPNILYDQKETNRLITEARAGVPLVKGRVLEGEKIVLKHQRITQEQIDKLQSLYQAEASRASQNIALRLAAFYVGTIALILIALFPLLLFILAYRPKIWNNDSHLVMIFGSMLVIIFFAFIAERYGISRYAIPVAAVPMMITYYFDNRVSLLSGVTLAILVGSMFGNDFSLGVISIFIVSVGVWAVGILRNRRRLTNSVFFLALAYIFSILLMGLFQAMPVERILHELLGGLANSVLTPVLTFGFLVFFDMVFDVCSEYKLLEFSDLNHPLLKMLAVRAPGTYHHSILVSNLAEAAAEAIRANSLLAKVGAYYHDIGKMYMPEYFIENQRDGKNPHENLAPRISSLILQNHVKKGLEFADQYNLPSAIKDFILQHHGTSLMKFFYEKALKQSKGVPVNEADFRYQGVKPQTRETGILMLADNVEALARSISDVNVGKIRNAIRSVIEGRFEEGQLDECPLTVRELRIIGEAFEQILIGVHHERVKYPDQDKMISGKKEEKPAATRKPAHPKEAPVEDKSL